MFIFVLFVLKNDRGKKHKREVEGEKCCDRRLHFFPNISASFCFAILDYIIIK